MWLVLSVKYMYNENNFIDKKKKVVAKEQPLVSVQVAFIMCVIGVQNDIIPETSLSLFII